MCTLISVVKCSIQVTVCQEICFKMIYEQFERNDRCMNANI